MNKKTDFQLVNPFSEKFLDTWELYKAYRKEVHDFKFKGVISEQMILKKLVELSGGDEERAIRIVEQTISSGKWMGFYPLRQTKYKEDNGKSKTNRGTKKSDASLTDKVKYAANFRYGGGGQAADGSNLKAV